MTAWRKVNPLFVGFEGGPGHQLNPSPGAYKHSGLGMRNRWDTVVSEIGGTWDSMLAKGDNVWGALAVSDYHEAKNDAPPCAFARTHVMVPRKDEDGLLRALRAGSFWADHGQILTELSFQVMAPGLPAPALVGETLRIGEGTPVDLSVNLKRGPGADNAPLMVDVIGNGRTGRPEILAQGNLSASQDSYRLSLKQIRAGEDGKSAYFRVRVRKLLADGGELLAYTNPIRVLLPD